MTFPRPRSHHGSAGHRSFAPVVREPQVEPYAASPLSAPLHGAFYLDDDLLEDLQPALGDPRVRAARAREAFRGIRQRDSARVLARLGGTEPDIKAPGWGR